MDFVLGSWYHNFSVVSKYKWTQSGIFFQNVNTSDYQNYMMHHTHLYSQPFSAILQFSQQP